MPEQVIMPRLSDTMTEGTVAKWLKHPGDQVKRGEPLVEIETDKASIELEAYASGTLRRIILSEGGSAPVGEPIGEIALPGEDTSEAEAPPSKEPARAAAATKEPQRELAPTAVPSVAEPRSQASSPSPVVGEREEGLRASPLARRVARELRVDLSRVKGSGPQGRIQKEDVEAAAAGSREQPPTVSPQPAAPAPDDTELVPLSRMQQTIARRMAEAKATVPHFYISMEVDMEAAMQMLDGLNEGLQREERVTVNDLLVKACGVSLRAFPDVNSSYQDGHLLRHRRVHVGFAVAVPNGLLVPVVRDVDRKNLREVSAAARTLAHKAREGKIEPSDYEGGTFSVSNLGMFGVDEFQAIINPPQSAIVAVGAVQPKPVVRDGQVVVSRRMTVTLSADHRVFYGFTGAEFLRDLKSRLEKPLSIVL